MRLIRWVKKKVFLLFGYCPYCRAKLENGFSGIFLNGFRGCPNGHYGEETVAFAGTVVYDGDGRIVIPPRTPKPPTSRLRIVP